MFPLKVLAENPSLPVPASGGSRSSLPGAASAFTCPSPLCLYVLSSFIKTLVIGLMTHLVNLG